MTHHNFRSGSADAYVCERPELAMYGDRIPCTFRARDGIELALTAFTET